MLVNVVLRVLAWLGALPAPQHASQEHPASAGNNKNPGRAHRQFHLKCGSQRCASTYARSHMRAIALGRQFRGLSECVGWAELDGLNAALLLIAELLHLF